MEIPTISHLINKQPFWHHQIRTFSSRDLLKFWLISFCSSDTSLNHSCRLIFLRLHLMMSLRKTHSNLEMISIVENHSLMRMWPWGRLLVWSLRKSWMKWSTFQSSLWLHWKMKLGNHSWIMELTRLSLTILIMMSMPSKRINSF